MDNKTETDTAAAGDQQALSGEYIQQMGEQKPAASSEPPSSVFCTNCGRALSPAALFCTTCGKPTAPQNAPGQTQPAPPPGSYQYNTIQPPPYTYQAPGPYVPQPQFGAQPGYPPAPAKKKMNPVSIIVIAVLAVGLLTAGGIVIKNAFFNKTPKTDIVTETPDNSADISNNTVTAAASPEATANIETTASTPNENASIVSEGVDKTDLGNILNGQYYFDDGTYVFYSSFDTLSQAHIYRQDIKTGETQSIFDGFGWSLVVNDGWLYFSGNRGTVIDGTYNLFRMKIDGSSLETLNTGYCYGMFVYQQWLYYVRQSSGGSGVYAICRSLLDGTEEVTIAENASNQIIIDNMLFFRDSINDTIIRANVDGSDQTVIISGSPTFFVIGNGKIVYYDSDSNIYSSEFDGSKQTLLRSAGSNPLDTINT